MSENASKSQFDADFLHALIYTLTPGRNLPRMSICITIFTDGAFLYSCVSPIKRTRFIIFTFFLAHPATPMICEKDIKQHSIKKAPFGKCLNVHQQSYFEKARLKYR